MALPGPRDAAVMEAVLKEMGVEHYDRSVVYQMLEFSYTIVSVHVYTYVMLYVRHGQDYTLQIVYNLSMIEGRHCLGIRPLHVDDEPFARE